MHHQYLVNERGLSKSLELEDWASKEPWGWAFIQLTMIQLPAKQKQQLQRDHWLLNCIGHILVVDARCSFDAVSDVAEVQQGMFPAARSS